MVFYPFEVTVPHIIYACLGGFIVLFGMFSLFLRERDVEACWAFLFGVIIGPYCADIFNPRSWAHDEEALNVITLEFTRVILAVGVFAIGVELPKAYMKRHWKSLFFLLVPVMTWGWLVSAAFIYALIPGLNFLTSLAVAACLTPTDPILRPPLLVASGRTNTFQLTYDIYSLLSPVATMEPRSHSSSLRYTCFLIIPTLELRYETDQVILGVVLGAAIGIAFRYLMKFCERMDLIDRHSYVAQYVSLAMFTIGVCTLLGSDDLLAAFACGTAFAWDGFFNRQTEESVFSSVIDLLFNVAAFIYIGAWMPLNKFQDAELTLSVWRLLVIAILVLLFRRLPIMIACYKWIPDVKNFREAVFCGHFGPVGIGAIFISTLTLEIIHRAHKTEENASNYHQIEMLVETIHPIVGFMVLCSITVHGLSIPSFSLGRRVHSVSRTWSRHATGASMGGTPEWAHQTTLVNRGDEKIIINRDENRQPIEVDVERGSDSEKTKEGSGGSLDEKDFAHEPESSGTPADRLEIRIDSPAARDSASPRDVRFLDLEDRRRSVNLGSLAHASEVATPPKVYTPPRRHSVTMKDMLHVDSQERMTGRGGDTEADEGETISEWQEGNQWVIERKRGPGQDPEVTVIRDPNAPEGFGTARGNRGVTSPPPHIVITGDESGDDDDGWASEDNEGEGSKDGSPKKSRRARIAHFMGKKKRRSSFRGGREGVHVEDISRPQIVEDEEERRGRERPSLVHRRLGSDFAGGLTVDSARHPGRVSTRESSPARSVRFQDGSRPSHVKHDSQKSVVQRCYHGDAGITLLRSMGAAFGSRNRSTFFASRSLPQFQRGRSPPKRQAPAVCDTQLLESALPIAGRASRGPYWNIENTAANGGTVPTLQSPYNYIPSKWAGFLFTTLFAISTIAHIGVAFKRRMWWILPTVGICGILEVIGWGARLWSSYSPYERMPFIMQISTTVLAPTPLLAAVFLLSGQVIRRLGSVYSRLNAKYYTIVFCSCDVIALLIQGGGGGIASSAATGTGDPTLGSNIMLGGIIFQTAVIIIFALCCLEYFVRYFRRRPIRNIGYYESSTTDTDRGEFTKPLKIMVSALAFITLILFIRAVYRTIELADGWTGRIISTESYFLVLDALMIVMAMFTLNFIHPWEFLYKDPVETFRLVPTHRRSGSE
ncbi:hypothetical protein NMY22_g10341 [Coprinellus aureogranulatus]|nr:hypothetical protein NMY22_g10341 [Coprinellus aureogranulatus]